MELVEMELDVADTPVQLAYGQVFPEASAQWYWASLWPASLALADYVLSAPRPLEGCRVLELGCGAGLSGIAAGLRGAEVTVTDVMPEALELAEANWARNGVEPAAVESLDWCAPVEEADYDVVLGADILYDPKHHAALLNTLQRVASPEGELVIAEPGRPSANGFFARLLQAGYRMDTRHVPVELHDERFEISVNHCC
jgi:predicted nicotinamide N-methyase